MSPEPGTPDVLPQLTDAMRRRGCPQTIIDRFAQTWNALPEGSHDLPCPLCFMHGAKGRLVQVREANGQAALCCTNCRGEVFLRRAS